MSGPFDQTPADAALAYAAHGWAVFPCHSPVPSCGCSCGNPACPSPGKHPRVPTGLKAATTDRLTVAAWWQRWPGANVAIRTGAVSGLVVIDVDPPHGGDASVDALVRRHGALPHGRAVRTGSGGSHLYLAHPGRRVRNDAGTRLGPGIDIRGDGGYVIAPPSRHPSGGSYSWVQGRSSLPEIPAWMLDRLRPPERRSVPPPRASDRAWGSSSAWARTALDRELDLVRTATEGSRNATLNRAAFSLGQIVGGGGLDSAEVESLLLGTAGSIGLGEREARLTIASGMAAGAETPRRPPAPRREPVSLEVEP